MTADEISNNWKHLPTHDYDELTEQIKEYGEAEVKKFKEGIISQLEELKEEHAEEINKKIDFLPAAVTGRTGEYLGLCSAIEKLEQA